MQQLQRVIRGDYKIPSRVKISEPCRDLLNRILQVNVAKRITIPEILKHKWCAPASPALLSVHACLRLPVLLYEGHPEARDVPSAMACCTQPLFEPVV